MFWKFEGHCGCQKDFLVYAETLQKRAFQCQKRRNYPRYLRAEFAGGRGKMKNHEDAQYVAMTS